MLAAAAPAFARCAPLREQWLMSVLTLPNEGLLRAAGVEDPSWVLRCLELPALTERVPTALCCHDAAYPRTLLQLPNAPAVLYATCSAERLRELLSPASPRVAIVGSRGLTPYAKEITFTLTRDLARAGVTVVSSVNEGPDGIAHEGALEAGGRSIAVMACSPEISHLTWQAPLHQRILAHGTAISELPPGFYEPQRWCFLASRRIIAALADVIVIVEAGGFTNAALTTKIATELGRDIAVVPTRFTDPSGNRILWLLKDGAHPVATAEDVLEVIHRAGLRGPALHGPALHDPTPHELADDPTMSGPVLHDPAPRELADAAGVPGPAMRGPTISEPALHEVAA
ncbi:MAG: DNA-processing protein DprA [Solirubrobacteraceae bacterium]